MLTIFSLFGFLNLVKAEINVSDDNLYNSLRGKIILRVEASGEAYYVHPEKQKMYYLGRPADAFQVMREQGVGITNNDLARIRLDYECPTCPRQSTENMDFAERHKGKIFLQVEENGEAWYVNPEDNTRHFLANPIFAFNVMRELGVGISEENFGKINSSQEDSDKKVAITEGGLTQNEYISRDLGVKFKYMADDNQGTICEVTREGNKLIICDTHSVEIFNKNVNDSLQQAVEKQFLANYLPEKCFFKEITTNDDSKKGIISYPIDENSTSYWWENAEHCPAYSELNGIRYFKMYAASPNSYAFFDIGQGMIGTEVGISQWFETFEFIN